MCMLLTCLFARILFARVHVTQVHSAHVCLLKCFVLIFLARVHVAPVYFAQVCLAQLAILLEHILPERELMSILPMCTVILAQCWPFHHSRQRETLSHEKLGPPE